ncbi:hypothetical protein PHISP_02603 [Aspergillus sp. HF37]|nr:hypothetical protein PHISP_02603 [Aspergillus sp. HF37]
MKHFASLAALAAGANALVPRADTCCFHLNASGGASGTLGQLGDGQVRVGDDRLDTSTFCISNNGSITDASGRGCILTPPTTQFQCDLGAKPIPGFSINSQGELEYKGDSSFIACETGQNGGMNIYTENSTDVTQCVDVTLNADSCAGAGAGGGAGGPGTGPSGTASAVPSGPSDVPGHPGAGPSGTASAFPSGPSGGAGGPGVGPSGTMPGSTSVVSVATPSSSAPGADGGGGPMTGGPGAESSAAGGAGGGFKTTIRTTETLTVCPTAGPGAGGQPSGPVAGGGGAPTSSGAGGQATTSPGATSVTPSGTGARSASTGTLSGTAAGGQPTGPGAGAGGSSGPGAGGGGGDNCPIDSDLSGDYEFPHLIIPVDSSAPNKVPGTALNGTVTDTVSTIFNFDIPKSDAGKTCNLVFLFPEQHELETSAFSFSGNGKIDFAKLSGDATQSTCYSNRPSVAKDYGVTKVSPGNSYLIATFSCPAGETVSFQMSDAGTTELEYFQDYNPKP